MLKLLKNELFEPSRCENKFDAICFNIVLFDIFFLPLFPWFSVSISLPIFTYWYLKRRKEIRYFYEYKNFHTIVWLMILSTLINLVYTSDMVVLDTTFFTAIKRFFQYLTSFWLYYLLYYFFNKYNRSINNIVFWSIICILVYALIYSFNQELFILIKQNICPFDPQVERWLSNTLLVYRFNYLWADSNNVAYTITGMSIFYLIEDFDIVRKYLVIAISSFILILTMSIGGIAIFVFLLSYVVFCTKSLRSSKKAYLLGLLMITIIIGFCIYNWDFFSEILESGLLKRTELYGDDGVKDGGGRIHDLIRGLGFFNPLFFICGSGKEGFVSEIGHIYVAYMYGIPVYCFFMYILFRKHRHQTIKSYLPIIPFFVAFSVNIAIIEQKVLLILVLFSAYYSAKSTRLLQGKKSI